MDSFPKHFGPIFRIAGYLDNFYYYYICFIETLVFNANSVDPDLGLHLLPVTFLRVSKLTWVIIFIGINTGVPPMYLAEIAPLSLRGLCGVFNQLAMTVGLLAADVIGLQEILGGKDTWQYALGKILALC